jgi:glycosyltransferase involved in cell wall biosynthesis
MSARVLVWPMNKGASAFYRLRSPATALQTHGADVIVVDDPGVRAPEIEWDEDGSNPMPAWPPPDARPLAIKNVDADVVVLQRPARRWYPLLIDLLHQVGVKVVVDIDDRLDRLHPRSTGFHNYDPEQSPNQNWKWLDAACMAADVVTCTTPSLADRYGFGHVAVLPNLVPTFYLSVNSDSPLQRSVVWPGNVFNHCGDLEATDGGIARALKGTDWFVQAIGNGIGVAQGLGVESCTDTGGRVALTEYPRELARATIGIVPLEDSVFNHGKSALKMSEFAALGVPVVASPSPDNRRVHELGVGLLASRRKQWQQQVRRLIDNPDLRAQLAEQGRQVMASQTYDQQAERWWSAWATPLKP